MNFEFYWNNFRDEPTPNCRSDAVGRDGVDFLACLLGDDGGRRFNTTLDFITQGLRSVELVRSGQLNSADWSREAWGAEIEKKGVKIYSLYDEDFSITISLDDFERAMSGWKDFLASAQ